MLHHLVGWLRAEARTGQAQVRWARWIGRNWARVSYAYHIEPTWLELNHLDIPVPGLPAPFAGFRIVQLSDFHCSRQVTPAYLEEAVDLAQSQQADLAVLTGDFVHKGYKYVDQVARILSRLSAPCGVFAVLGNHDFSVRNALGFRRYRHLHRAVAAALTAHGIRVLHNEMVRLRRQDAVVQLVGVEDLWSRALDLDRAFAHLSPEAPCVVLAHNPRTVERLHGRRCDLMLSGHTHGGQVNLPGLGRPTLSRQARKFAAGLYRYRHSYVYVNKGVGFGFRFRFGVRPEVAVLSLRIGIGH
ncbi:MAG: phosphodiesterase YaeI [Planctomycetes bacterium]|nr:phosphodiesterase YaeI [Planctomycetota bacterium]